MEQVLYSLIERDMLSLIRPLWESLNRIHGDQSSYFKHHYRRISFDLRSQHFFALPAEDLRIETATLNGEIVGYCIASLRDKIGEIDSIYIRPELRGKGVGQHLMATAVAWLKERRCSKIQLAVAEGNEAVIPFYERFGFFPRLTYLELKE